MGAGSRWRAESARVIGAVLDARGWRPGDEATDDLRRAISAAYPFGPRRMHPYKVWLDEVQVQLGERRPADRRGGTPGRTRSPEVDDRLTLDLFPAEGTEGR